MNINCYLSQNCGAEEALRKNIARTLAVEKVKAEVNFHRIDDEKAIAFGLSGSPIDGSGRLTNVPTVETIRAAIREQT